MQFKNGIFLCSLKNIGTLSAQITQWDLIFHGTETSAQPNDPTDFGIDSAISMDQNSLDFDRPTANGQWRNMQHVNSPFLLLLPIFCAGFFNFNSNLFGIFASQVGESHVDVQRTAPANDQIESACLKATPNKHCIGLSLLLILTATYTLQMASINSIRFISKNRYIQS